MTGLLRSLAAQALGLPPTMRPAARLRAGAIAIPPDLARDPESFSTPTPAATVGESLEHALERTSAAPPASMVVSAIDAAIPDREEPGRIEHGIARPAVEESRSVHEPPWIASVIEPREHAPAEAPANQSIAAVVSRDFEPLEVSDALVRPRRRPTSSRARGRADTVRFEVPVRARESNRREEPVPDVHIHIGRVELTAVTAPAPARRGPATQARKPLSLDEYLEQRKRKTP